MESRLLNGRSGIFECKDNVREVHATIERIRKERGNIPPVAMIPVRMPSSEIYSFRVLALLVVVIRVPFVVSWSGHLALGITVLPWNLPIVLLGDPSFSAIQK